MELLGDFIGGIFFIVVILWLLITIGSFFTAWISMMLLMMQAKSVWQRSNVSGIPKLMASYDDIGRICIDQQYAKRRRILMISASIFVTSLLCGMAVMFAAKKLHA